MSTERDRDDVLDVIVEDRIDASIDEPKMYCVIMLNDDYTPFDFVAANLQTVFHHPEAVARTIAREVHEKGKAIAGTYTHEIAETKSTIVNIRAEQSQFPFKTVVEAE